jgi:ubiquinone biosynthesis protein
LGVTRERIDRSALRRDLQYLISQYYGQTLGEIDLTPLLNDGLAVTRKHQLHLPPELALLFKTIIITEGMGARLDPGFHLLSVIVPYTNKLFLKLYSPRRWLGKLRRAGSDLAWLGTEAPHQLRRMLGQLERGGFEVGMKPESLDPLISRLERLANRIVLGILAAAFIVGLSSLLSVYRPAGWQNWAGAMFAIGFIFAIVLGVYLAWSILRSRRDRS